MLAGLGNLRSRCRSLMSLHVVHVGTLMSGFLIRVSRACQTLDRNVWTLRRTNSTFAKMSQDTVDAQLPWTHIFRILSIVRTGRTRYYFVKGARAMGRVPPLLDGRGRVGGPAAYTSSVRYIAIPVRVEHIGSIAP